MRRAIALVCIALLAGTAAADPDPKRKVAVLEYRAGSSALPGIAARLVDVLSKQTSLQLLGPDQASVIFGNQLEQAVAKCAGESGCIAQIGKKVGAAEVLLVGVSELGDVILTMQRIDVASQSVAARIADSLAEGAQPSAAQVDQYLARLLPPTDFLRYGVIDIIASEAGAAVMIGGEQRGTTPIEPVKLRAPATYDIRVEKLGFVPFTASVVVPPDGEVQVRATLQRPGSTAWYQRWYVLAAGGLLVAGAAGTAIYFATADDGNDVRFGGGIR